MKINDFASLIAHEEAGKSQATIGDIRQILRLTDKLVGGLLYKAIKGLPGGIEVETVGGRPKDREKQKANAKRK